MLGEGWIAGYTVGVRGSLTKLHRAEKTAVISTASAMEAIDLSNDLAHAYAGFNPLENCNMHI